MISTPPLQAYSQCGYEAAPLVVAPLLLKVTGVGFVVILTSLKVIFSRDD